MQSKSTESSSIEQMRSQAKFSVIVIGALFIGLLAPAPWFAARTTPSEPYVVQGGASIGPIVTIASINTAKVTDIEAMAREIEAHSRLRAADVLFLQEVVRAGGSELSTGELLARRLGREAVFAAPDGGKTHSGLAILAAKPLQDSKVRALKNVNLIFRTRKRIALIATANTPAGAIRVINTHLDTRINPKERLEQLGPALEEARAFVGPVIIGGDLNTNDMQWVSHVVPVPYPGWQAKAVRKLMVEQGFSTPFELRRATFDHLKMQLDWLFCARLRPSRSAIQPLVFSDHHAIWAEFRGATAAHDSQTGRSAAAP
jgi:endonuclease/exonuclease/phosphatase family metal-dependent hydrolase